MIRFDHVSFEYAGGMHAGVTDLDFRIHAGQTVLLCGDSGCGKTTVTRLINGLAPHYFDGTLTGRVTVAGLDTANASGGLAGIAQHVGSVFQNPKSQFFTLDVTGELAFACENFRMPPAEIRERIGAVARDFHMEDLLGRPITALSGGQKQKVACASVSTAGPDVLVLDEPSSNLDARAIEDLRGIVALWKRQGKTVVIAEHRLYWLDGLVDRALYLRDGRLEREMSGDELRALSDDERLGLGLRPVRAEQIAAQAAAMMRSADAAQTPDMTDAAETPNAPGVPDGTIAAVATRTNAATDTPTPSRGDYVVDRFSYTYRRAKAPTLSVDRATLPAGRVTAVTGFNGAGKSTFVRCLQGLDRRCKGDLVTPPPDSRALNRKARLKACFTVLQDVNCELFTESVLDEVLLAMPERGDRDGQQDADAAPAESAASAESAREQAARGILARLDLADVADRHPLSLSGGQKQRVAIAAALASARGIIIFDEPTSGLDMRHMRQVAGLLRGLAASGRTVVVVTHDPEFALCVADDVLTIDHGRAVDAYPLRVANAADPAHDRRDPHDVLDAANARRLVRALTARTASVAADAA
ncbi:ABC transporter [Bifidobacterium sp. DSM 109958]|uniref:ABC transporter n=1 Tax=Bifidobacterium moraviense TaxID=2675323 RepID=A0A7Y0F256_9BIFI|nr:ABC transporter ATP-binding protein [Bifidobacterium sp. DSM 109958]NMN00469.1 ABC transporter [Bifidobacterium sp. DSM 109958]